MTSDFSGVRPGGWTHDGRSVVYVGVDSVGGLGALHEIRARPWDGSGVPVVLVRRNEGLAEVSITAARGYLAVGVGVSTFVPGDIWLMPLGGSGTLAPFVATPAAEWFMRFSPSGQYLAYVSNETGKTEVYVKPVPGPGGRLQVSSGGGDEPVWAPGDRELFYRTPTHLVTATLSLGTNMTVVRRDTLFADTYARGWINYDVFPNGREFVMIKGLATTGKFEVILNWQALLRKP